MGFILFLALAACAFGLHRRRGYGMPPFYQDLSDHDVASVVTFIRRSWGNNAPAVSQPEAARLRGIPAD